MKLAVLLFVAAGVVTVKGGDLAQHLDDEHDLRRETLVGRPKRWSVFDTLRGRGTKPPRPAGGDGNGFNLADALRPGPQTPKPAGGNGAGFRLEDALRPAGKPTDEPSGGDCQGSVVQKLSTVLQNQNQQLRLLLQLLAGSSPAAMA
ncbi:uncharacterized protein PAE49_012795 isoform 2-T2 [Odontesthes bonariensis]